MLDPQQFDGLLGARGGDNSLVAARAAAGDDEAGVMGARAIWMMAAGLAAAGCGRLGYGLSDGDDEQASRDAGAGGDGGGGDAAPFSPGPPAFAMLIGDTCLLWEGQIRCWGGTFGLDPTPVAGARWVELAGGELHRCAIDADRALYCWGDNSDGALGVGDQVARAEPTHVTPDRAWRQVGAGRFFTCAISGASELYCWGRNTEGQLGAGVVAGVVDRPLRIGTATDWLSIGNAGNHICGIRTGDQLFCWGANDRGQVGVGMAGPGVTVPTPQPIAGAWRQVSIGKEHTCGIQTDDTLWCWGRNFEGQLGLGVRGDGTDQLAPVQVGDATDWQSIGLGRFASCGVRAGGLLSCWGNNELNEVGIPGATYYVEPTQVDQQIWQLAGASQGSHMCGLHDDGAALCWGANTAGQLGTGDTEPRDAPTLVPLVIE